MANREENLKKINEKLEQLTDEQLEDIAGGMLFNVETNTPFKGIGVNVDPKNNIGSDNKFIRRPHF